MSVCKLLLGYFTKLRGLHCGHLPDGKHVSCHQFVEWGGDGECVQQGHWLFALYMFVHSLMRRGTAVCRRV